MNKMEPWRIENIFTMIIVCIACVGLYYLGAGGHSFWPFFLLLNLNSPK